MAGQSQCLWQTGAKVGRDILACQKPSQPPITLQFRWGKNTYTATPTSSGDYKVTKDTPSRIKGFCHWTNGDSTSILNKSLNHFLKAHRDFHNTK